MRVRRTKLLRDAGPYRVVSCVDGTLHVYPEWSGYKEGAAWKAAEADTKWEGGGPGFLTRMALASDLERWLNRGNAYGS